MRELIVLSGLMFLGYLAESSARCLLNESCRIYVQQRHEAAGDQRNSEQIQSDLKVAAETKNALAEVTAANNPEDFGLHRF